MSAFCITLGHYKTLAVGPGGPRERSFVGTQSRAQRAGLPTRPKAQTCGFHSPNDINNDSRRQAQTHAVVNCPCPKVWAGKQGADGWNVDHDLLHPAVAPATQTHNPMHRSVAPRIDKTHRYNRYNYNSRSNSVRANDAILPGAQHQTTRSHDTRAWPNTTRSKRGSNDTPSPVLSCCSCSCPAASTAASALLS